MTNNYETFNDVKNVALRVFNRVVLLNNLFSDFGKEAAESYAASFNEGERKQLFIMQEYIKAKGLDKVKQEVVSSLVPEDEEVAQ